MYQFNHPQRLKTLSVEGDSNLLRFGTASESAVIKISDGKIESVLHKDLVNNSEKIINHDDPAVHYITVGSGNTQRDVYHFLKPNPAKHLTLRLGLTIHRGEGTWSSLPHDFEKNPEADFEEVFFYLLKGGSGKAIQVGRGLWADGSNADLVCPVADRTFSVIPCGYHPVVGEPGVQVSYVWAYLAKKAKWEKI